MYGMKVHQAVLANQDKETGITIHFVNDHYDKGEVIFQAKCKVAENDTAETIREKGRSLELESYPKMIEKLLMAKDSA